MYMFCCISCSFSNAFFLSPPLSLALCAEERISCLRVYRSKFVFFKTKKNFFLLLLLADAVVV